MPEGLSNASQARNASPASGGGFGRRAELYASRPDITHRPACIEQTDHRSRDHEPPSAFHTGKGRILELTDAGRAFVEEARAALFHAERAIHLAHAAQEGAENVLLIGHSHYADRIWISALFAIRLPLFPKLRIRLVTRSAMELARAVIGGELNLALVTAPPVDAQITRVPFANAPLHVALPGRIQLPIRSRFPLRDLATDEWIMLARNVHPIIHDAILQTALIRGNCSEGCT